MLYSREKWTKNTRGRRHDEGGFICFLHRNPRYMWGPCCRKYHMYLITDVYFCHTILLRIQTGKSQNKHATRSKFPSEFSQKQNGRILAVSKTSSI